MTWIKIGILVIGALYAILLPYAVYKTLKAIKFDPKKYTLSFLSNKEIYSLRMAKGYTRILIATAVIHHVFFLLLTEYYFLEEDGRFLKIVSYSSFALLMLGLLRHNILPYSFKTLRATIQRLSHNIAAAVVFILLPLLIIIFQSLVIGDHLFLGVGGFIIIGLTLFVLLLYIIRHGLDGIAELIFINGLSSWSIFVAAVTLFQ